MYPGTTINIKASCLRLLAEGAAFLGAARHTLGAEYAATARKHHLFLTLYTRPMTDNNKNYLKWIQVHCIRIQT
jgi:hypothetical protein